ncbi:mesotocin receptor-like [Glandiceps talaboti]
MNTGYGDNPGNRTELIPVAYGTREYVTPTSAMINMSDMYNTSSNATEPRKIERDEFLAMIEILVQVIIIVLALIGNLCVLISLWRKRRTLTRMHIFIMHLAIADLFSVFFGVMPQLIWDITFKFLAPDFICRFVKFVQVAMGMYLPTYVLVMTALDRYMAICHPMSGMKGTQVRVRIMIGTAWVMSFIFSIPQIFIFHLAYHAPDFPYCSSQRWFIRLTEGPRIYFTTVTIMVIILPSIILAWAYGMIWREVWRNAQLKTQWESKAHRPTYANGHAHSFSNSLRNGDLHPNARGTLIPRAHYSGRGITKAKIKMAKMTLVIVIVYFLCWTPFFSVQLWVAYGSKVNVEVPVNVVLQLLATLNSCTNPWIYMAFSGNLLNELKHVCCGQTIGLFRRSGTMNSSDRDRYGSARFYKTAATRTGSCTTGVSLMPNKTACVNFTCAYNYEGEVPPVTSVSSESHSRARDSSSLPTTPSSSDTKHLAKEKSKKSENLYVEMFTSV